MQWILALLTVCAFAFPALAARPSGNSIRLLNYQQLVKLSPAKRMKYLHDLRKLLVMMETLQQSREYADNGRLREMRGQIAMLSKELRFLPQAAAEPGSQDKAPNVKPVWMGDYWGCADGYEFSKQLGACMIVSTGAAGLYTGTDHNKSECPKNTVEVPHPTKPVGARNQNLFACIPTSNWKVLSASRQKNLKNGIFYSDSFWERKTAEWTKLQKIAVGELEGDLKPTQPYLTDPRGRQLNPPPAAPKPAPPMSPYAAGAGNGSATAEQPVAGATVFGASPESAAAAKSESAKPAASAAGEQCVTARPVACADLSDEERKLAGIRFRKAPGEAVCISGAFRQKYVGDKKVPGGCKPLGHIEFTSGKKECPKGATKQAACNPVVFCLKDKTKESGGLAMLCVDKKPGKNPPVTEMCDQKYELFLKVPMEKGSSEKRFENCDPTKITAKDLPEGLATASAYKEMVDATQNLADEWCVANADFQALNCRECATILKHIHAMNKEATGAGCVAENTAAPAGQMSPYAPDQGGEAPTAVPEGRKSGSTDDN